MKYDHKPSTCIVCFSGFSPQTSDELNSAIIDCLEISENGDCTEGQHGPIGEWDVSRITAMDDPFSLFECFNGDISKWNVSSVTTMEYMFSSAECFNKDIPKWDVSAVTTMESMFEDAIFFNRDISEWMCHA